MSNPKRQHYIPRMLLKHFVDSRGHLHFLDKDSLEKGVRAQNPKTLFYERHLYSFFDSDGERDYSTERRLAKIEDKASPIVEKIVENARKNDLPDFTAHEKEVWVEFFYMLWRRLPALRDRSTSNQIQLEKNQKDYRIIRGIAETEPIDLKEMEEFLKQQSWPRAIQQSNELVENRILPTLRRMSLWVAVLSNRQSGFVIGSYPILKVRPDLDLDHPDAEVWMPLAHDVAVILIHDRLEILWNPDDRFTQKLNGEVFDQSTIVAGRSREQIESLAAVANKS